MPARLKVMTAVRKVKTLVINREIRDALRAHSNGKAEPVVEAWILNLILYDAALPIGECHVANLTTPRLNQRE